MKKVLFKLPDWWKAETPVFARFFQLISSAIAALPLYYAALPTEFKEAIPDSLPLPVEHVHLSSNSSIRNNHE